MALPLCLKVLGLLQNVPSIYPARLKSFLLVVSQSTSADTAVSLDCSLPDYAHTSKAIVRTLILALVPLYVGAACSLAWLLRAVWLYTTARW